MENQSIAFSEIPDSSKPQTKRPGLNKRLYDLRQKNFLSLKEMSKKTHISLIKLYMYERGYLPLFEKDIRILNGTFGLDESYFAPDEGYPEPISKEDKYSPKAEALKNRFFSKPSLFITASLALISAVLVIVSVVMIFNVNTNVAEYYGQDAVNVVNCIIKNGETDTPEEASDPKATVSLSYDDGSDNLHMTSLNDIRNLSWSSYQFTFKSSSDNVVITYNEVYVGELVFTFEEDDPSTSSTLYTGSGTIESGKFLLYELSDKDGNDVISDETVKSAKESLVASYSSKTDDLFAKWVASAQVDCALPFSSLIKKIADGNLPRYNKSKSANNILLFSSLGCGIFLFAALLILSIRIIIKKKGKVEEIEVQSPSVEASPSLKPLKKNWKIAPFIPETVLRGVVIVLIGIFSVNLFKITDAASQTINNIGNMDLMDIISVILNLKDSALTIMNVKPYLPLGMLLWFFVRVEIMHGNGNLWPQIVMFFFFGIMYYIAENLLSFYLNATSNEYYVLLLTVFKTFMPGNLFWGIGCFSLIVLFTLTTPSFIKDKKKVKYWRALSFIPIAYLVYSYLYSVGTKIWGWKEFPDLVASLLFRKQFAITVFAILYPQLVFLYRKRIMHVYGKENAEKYYCGNRYYFMKNLIAVLIICLIATINIAMQGNKLAKTLDMNNKYWYFLLTPLVLFYHPHVGKRSSFFDLSITTFYIVMFSLAYVYLAILILFVIPPLIGF